MSSAMDSAGQAHADRSACIALAAWLHAQARLAPLAWLLALIGGVVLVSGRASLTGMLLAAAVLVLVLAERYLALRIAFDAALFAAWGRGALDADALDAALLRLKQKVLPMRPFDDRMAGALRLQRLYLGVIVAQLALLAMALWTTLR